MRSERGVKQGCPLSPTLFGLLLDGLHWQLKAGAPNAGPALACGRRVRDLGYADDFCLLATTAADLQRLLDIAYDFLTRIGMAVSATKTRVLVFSGGLAEPALGFVWLCGGVPLERVAEYSYLGMKFSALHGLGAGLAPLQGRLHASWAKLQGQFGELHDGRSVWLMRALFLAAVPPAGSYGCEVWGVRFQGQRQALAKTHVQLLRRLLRLPKSVSAALVLRELGVASPQALWLRGVLRFLDALARAPADSLWRAVALSDWDDAIVRNVKNWAWYLYSTLRDLDYPVHIDRRALPLVVAEDVMTLFDEREQACWADLDVCPQTCARDRATLCKYERWMALPPGVPSNAFLRLRLSPAQMFKVVRFRLGCSKLPIYTGRHARVRRAARFCRSCDQGALGDELHVLFQCPATAAARAPFAHLFPQGCTMLQLMGQDILSVARCYLAVIATLD